MHATLAGLLSLCLGSRASPRGSKFGISILRGNGPPFAACHHKIGSFGLARVPPAERGPVFLLCSMTPLILPVDFLSSLSWLLLLSLSLLLSSYFITSPQAEKHWKNQRKTATSPTGRVHLVILCHLNRHSFFPNE